MDNFWIRHGLKRFKCVGKNGCGLQFEDKEEFFAHRATLPTRTEDELTREEKAEAARSKLASTMKSRPHEA